jgi:hypothetical protein
VGSKTHAYLTGTVYVGTASTDVTTNIIRRLKELTGDMTARLKSIFVSAGTSN